MKISLVSIEKSAEDIYTFWFKPPKKVSYIAGQFVELYLPHKNKDRRGDKRWFTLSSSPTEELLAITTKFAKKDGSSFKKTMKSLKKDQEVNISFPMGDFVLPKTKSIPLLFIAGGIGSTPFRSIVKYVDDEGEERNITMFYGAKSKEEVAFKDIFQKSRINFRAVLGKRLTAEAVLNTVGKDEKRYIYISGPEPMVEALSKDFKNLGISKKKIYTDFFPGYN